MDPSDSFSLHFTNGTRLAGDVADGFLILNVPLLQLEGIAEVHVNLRGQVITKIGSHEEVLYPFHDTLGIWKKSSLSEEKLRGEHVIKEAFSFKLPYAAVASGEYGKENKGCSWPARMYCYIEAVAVHSDTSKPDIKTDRLFKYLNGDTKGAELSQSLSNGWTRDWQLSAASKRLRKLFSWKVTREATVTLSLPELEGFPIYTCIPFKLNISTLVKGKTSKPSTESSKLLGVDFTIVRDVHIKAHSKELTIEKELVAKVGSFGSLVEDSDGALLADRTPWMPIYDDEKQPTGTWKQEYDISSEFTLTCPPSVQYQTLKAEYYAQVKITSRNGAPQYILVPLEILSNRY
ncbi:hypothetical protein NM688_g1166 [Phlebia brevispora]|uniref:Uncharacterized protein n=1 Tax=Phlebia brevispora TaxID=194682 RepID=A0ACC1TBZ0_9APHY|nr:hypothetical protein NM688_g1166 [Phlebia brevispora]